MKVVSRLLRVLALFISTLVVSAHAQSPDRMMGVAHTRTAEFPVLARDLSGSEMYAPALIVMGLAIDSLAHQMGKFPKVPDYRVTHVVRGLLASYQTHATDTPESIFQRLRDQLLTSCEAESTPDSCLVTLKISSADWAQPTPNFQAPASQQDLALYDATAILKRHPEILDHVETLAKTGSLTLFGQTFKRDLRHAPMSNAERNELKLKMTEIYRQAWIARTFFETSAGWYWAEPPNPAIAAHPWGDVTIRSKKVPATYLEFVQQIERGLNQYYLRQKREEIFWGLMADHKNDVSAVAKTLLHSGGFYWVGSSTGPSYEDMKLQLLQKISEIQKSKSDLVARLSLLQALNDKMDRKLSLYDEAQPKLHKR